MSENNGHFYQGQLLRSLCVNDEHAIEVAGRKNSAKQIAVSMEAGQMAYTAWAICEMNNGKTYKYNLALVLYVELLEE